MAQSAAVGRGGRSVTDLAAPRATEGSEPMPASDVPGPHGRPPADAPPGVPLPRLIALAGLTPSQALEIAASALADAARQSATGAGGPGEAMADQVVVGADGRAVLGSAPAESVL